MCPSRIQHNRSFLNKTHNVWFSMISYIDFLLVKPQLKILYKTTWWQKWLLHFHYFLHFYSRLVPTSFDPILMILLLLSFITFYLHKKSLCTILLNYTVNDNKCNWQKVFRNKPLILNKHTAHLAEAERDWKF